MMPLWHLCRFGVKLTSLFVLQLDLESVEAEDRETEQLERLHGSLLCFSYQGGRKPMRGQVTPTKDIVPQQLDDQLLRLLTACSNLTSLGIGGRLLNIHLTTASHICRLLVKAAHARPRPPSSPPLLRADVASMRLSGPIPEWATERDSSMFLELMRDCRGKDVISPDAKQRAAECLIGAALGCPRWRFMQTDTYRRYVLSYATV